MQEAVDIFRPFADMQAGLNTNYDRETKHGANRIRQKEWNVAIAKKLDTLKNVHVNELGN